MITTSPETAVAVDVLFFENKSRSHIPTEAAESNKFSHHWRKL